MAVKLICIALAIFSILPNSLSIKQKRVDVSVNCTNSAPTCIELDDALDNLISDSILKLEPGEHFLRECHGSHSLGLHDVSVIGDSVDHVTIRCHDEMGLVFVNVTNLVLSNVIINGCGLTNDSLRDVIAIVTGFLDFQFFRIPYSIRIGLFLAHCTNLNLSNSMITNTTGLGMLGINLIGNSMLHDVSFTHNVRKKCKPVDEMLRYPYYSDPTDYDQIGGGAYILYQDVLDGFINSDLDSTELQIANCNFEYNAECSFAGYMNVNQYYADDYVIGGGGGLSIFMPQIKFPVIALINDSHFIRNEARYGGGAHIGLFANFVGNFVQFWRCVFDGNGLVANLDGLIDEPITDGGAGVAVFMDLPRFFNISGRLYNVSLGYCEQCKSVEFFDTNFTNNFAEIQGGGVLGYSISKTFHRDSSRRLDGFNAFMLLSGCLFRSNSAQYGSALYILQMSATERDGAWLLKLNNVFIEENKATDSSDGNIENSSSDKTSAMDLRGIFTIIEGGIVAIQDNSASGFYLKSATIMVKSQTSLIMKNNKAHRGGGIYMDGHVPMILMSANSTLTFENNVAMAEGGAVYYHNELNHQGILVPNNNSDCFLSTLDGRNIFVSDITVQFKDNRAPIGSIVFGSTLKSCYWVDEVENPNENLYLELYNNTHYNSTFHFSQVPQGKERISSEPYFIDIFPENNSTVSSYPGQIQNINISIMDAFKNEIEAVVRSDTTKEPGVTLGSAGVYYYIGRHKVPLYFKGTSNDNVTLSIYTASNLVSTDITVNVLECPIGFKYDNSSEKCTCSHFLDKYGVICDEKAISISITSQMWLGCEFDGCSAGDLILLECYFDYCNPSSVLFNSSDYSNQCARGSHKTGIMCGACEEGYSIRLGDNKCKKCKNTNIGIILTYSIVSGLLLFIFISLFGITIDKGWTNMFILFCNIVFPFNFYEATPAVTFKYLLIPMKWVSLSLGVGHCFCDGLTPLGKTAFGFLIPLYLYFLMGLFTLLCRCSTFVSTKFSPSQTLVTITFLSYIKVIQTCVDALVPLPIENLEGSSINESLRWLIDPNVVYFKGWHGALAFFCIVIMIVFISFPILLLFPTLAYRYAYRCKPFLDAIWNPFKPKCRVWGSMRIMLRILIVVFVKCVYFFPNGAHGIGLNIVVLTVFLYFQTLIQPFKSSLINIFDNLLILVSLFMHYGGYYLLYNRTGMSKISTFGYLYVYFFMVTAYIVLLSTFLWYSRSSAKRVLSILLRCCCKKKYPLFDTQIQQSVQVQPTHTSLSISGETAYQTLHHQQNFRRNFTRPRESLLEPEKSMSLIAS